MRYSVNVWRKNHRSEVMERIAVPMIGGMVSSTILTLIVIPAIYTLVKGMGLAKSAERRSRVLVQRLERRYDQAVTTAPRWLNEVR